MFKDFVIHGEIGDIDYTVYVSGVDIFSAYFFEEDSSGIRFFSRGNEFKITQDGISYTGTGGSFCEYMFGVEKPLKDTLKKDVLNRLVMFGAYVDKDDNIIFTNNVSGSVTFEKLFFTGHAIKNYFFIVSSDFKEEIKDRQAKILKAVGKFLKKSEDISLSRDERLLHEFIRNLNEPRSTLFIFKLLNRKNLEFYEKFRELYLNNKLIDEYGEMALNDIISKNQLNSYQIERMKIHVMYTHPENRKIVDEYSDILIDAHTKGGFSKEDTARLKRLRTLAIRNNIPRVLFDILDEMIKIDRTGHEYEEPEYIRDTRMIIENLFFKDPTLKHHIINEDIIKLLNAKHRAHQLNDMRFENILLDAVRRCDEICKDTGDLSVMETLGSIITYFDRYDNTYNFLSRIAFTEDMEINEETIRSLIGNREAFEELQKGLFKRLFVDEFLKNDYVTQYGKRKINIIHQSIERILNGDATVRDAVAEVRMVSDESRLYKYVYISLQENLRAIYPLLEHREGRKEILEGINKELRKKGIVRNIPERLFDKVLLDLKKESFYLNHIFPEILKTGNLSLREDFIMNSGFDRFHLENIEMQYLEEKGYPPDLIENLKGNRRISIESGIN